MPTYNVEKYNVAPRHFDILPNKFMSRSFTMVTSHATTLAAGILNATDDIGIPNGRSYKRSTSVDGKLYWKNKQRKRQSSAWTLDESAAGSMSPLSTVTNSTSSTPQLYYVTPPKSMAIPAASEGRLERTGSGRGGSFSRLARRLSQREKRSDREEKDRTKKTVRQRSVSLDCGDTRRPLADNGGQLASASNVCLSIPASPSLPSRMAHHHRALTHSPGALSRNSIGSRTPKSESKDKRKRNMQDLQDLFQAIEDQDLDKVKRILDTCVVDVNAQNTDELTPLDIAVFMNHVPMAKMLLAHGARENPRFLKTNEECRLKLANLVIDAEKRVLHLKNKNMEAITSGQSSNQTKEEQKLLNHWEYRLKFYQRMKKGYDGAKPPDEPSDVRLSVSSPNSIQINFDEPTRHNGAVVTRYKVEWSCYEGFEPLGGELVIADPQCKLCDIPNLAQGNVYYVRMRAWNLKGWSQAAVPQPACVTPTSWREIDNVVERTEGKQKLLSQLFVKMKNSRSPEAAVIKDQSVVSSPMPSRKSNVRKSIKNLFSGAPKFQKTLKRGVYLASIVSCEDRILVTHEDILPIIEVDENFTSANLNADFNWLMKIACTWEDVKSLRQDMDKIPSANAFHLRSKLLNAASHLQAALGMQDLGDIYHTPVKDTHGSIVLVTVATVRDTKAVSTAHCKWVTRGKLMKRIQMGDAFAAPEMLLQGSQEMLNYGLAAKQTLPKGLYLGYLKLTSSVELIRIMVPDHMPNVLPHARVRENPHVTRDEWEWVRKLSMNEVLHSPTELQTGFQKSVVEACKKLLNELGIDETTALNHRLHEKEVMELGDDVSFLLLLPPADSVCNVPGNREQLTHRPGYLTLPIQVFEMIHMCTYQYEFISRYCRLSSILEMDMYLAQQAQREAFSSEELSSAKQRVEQLSSFQKSLDEAWKSVRWTMEIITHARDKTVRGGLPLAILYGPPPSPPNQSPSCEHKSDVGSSTCSDPGYHSDLSSMDNSIEHTNCNNNHMADMIHKQGGGQHRSRPCQKRTQGHIGQGQSDCECDRTQNRREHSKARSSPSGSNNPRPQRHPPNWGRQQNVPPESDIINIRAAYDTGLTRGATVKLQITSGVTSRDVINIVVDQLNKKVLDNGLAGPLYAADEYSRFCLVAVIGARERVLRDDYQPLLLQYPWTRGQLCVRLKNDLLAALELQGGQVTNV